MKWQPRKEQLVCKSFKFDIEVSCPLKPNGKLKNVIENIELETKPLRKEDYVLIMGGTNVINLYQSNTVLDEIVNELERKIKLLFNTKIIISSVPFRYDIPYLNRKIRKLNQKLKILTN